MTQFMLVGSPRSMDLSPGVLVRPIPGSDDFLESVACHYFGGPHGCRVVTDESGRTEPLIDDVCDAQQLHRDIGSTAFVKAARTFVEEGIEFICWCSADHDRLPIVHSWAEFEEQLLSQTAVQPADLFVHFKPL